MIPKPWQRTPFTSALAVPNDATIVGAPSEQWLIEQFVADVAADGGPRLVVTDPANAAATISVELIDDTDAFDGAPAALGVSPSGGASENERYLLDVTETGAVVRALASEGLHRGLTTLRQLLPPGPEASLPAQRIVDTPRIAWRGLSFDVARHYQSTADLRDIVDLLSLYKFNVLHLHLSDNEAWRLVLPEYPALASAESYTFAELRELIEYARDRFVTVIPELDTPGHSAAVLRAYPELGVYEPDGEFPTAYLDPARPGVDPFVQTVVERLAELAPGPFVHIGGDEAFGMPDDSFTEHVGGVLARVRKTPKTTIGWQETTRAGLRAGEVFQYWSDFAEAFGEERDDTAAPTTSIPPETLAKLAEFFRSAREDLARGLSQGARVLLSPTRIAYFDAPHAGDAADPTQHELRDRVGYRHYPPRSLEELFAWDPLTVLGDAVGAEQLAGVEAALWAETVRSARDAQFLVTSRLPGFAERAWSPEGGTWEEFGGRLAAQAPRWRARGWTYFATTAVDWN